MGRCSRSETNRLIIERETDASGPLPFSSDRSYTTITDRETGVRVQSEAATQSEADRDAFRDLDRANANKRNEE